MTVANGSSLVSARGDHTRTRPRAVAVTQGNVPRVFDTASCPDRSPAVIVTSSRLRWSDSTLSFSTPRTLSLEHWFGSA